MYSPVSTYGGVQKKFPGQGYGQIPPGGVVPGQNLVPGQNVIPGLQQQQQFPIVPGQFTPGQFTPGQQYPVPNQNIIPGQYTPGQFTPGQYTPGQFTPGQWTPGRYRPVPFGPYPYPVVTPGQGANIAPMQQACPSDEDFQQEVENDPAINDIVEQVIAQIPPNACGVRPPQHRREERVIASECPPRTAVIRRRLQSPEPDTVERTTIVRAPQDTVNIVIEKPGMPPPCVYETTDYEPVAPPRIQQGVVCVQPSSQCPSNGGGPAPDAPDQFVRQRVLGSQQYFGGQQQIPFYQSKFIPQQQQMPYSRFVPQTFNQQFPSSQAYPMQANYQAGFQSGFQPQQQFWPDQPNVQSSYYNPIQSSSYFPGKSQRSFQQFPLATQQYQQTFKPQQYQYYGSQLPQQTSRYQQSQFQPQSYQQPYQQSYQYPLRQQPNVLPKSSQVPVSPTTGSSASYYWPQTQAQTSQTPGPDTTPAPTTQC